MKTLTVCIIFMLLDIHRDIKKSCPSTYWRHWKYYAHGLKLGKWKKRHLKCKGKK